MTIQRQASDLSENIILALRSVLGNEPQSLHTPSFHGNVWSYLKECLDSNYVSSVGKFVDRFEKDIADFTGARYAVAVVNGTAALHIALKLAGVGQNDEVLIPALTFVATANAVSYCNAIPHFVDSEEKTLGIDVEKLQNYLLAETIKKDDSCVNRKTGRIIRAIVPMHTFGHPSNLEGLLSLCREFNLVMVEDAEEAIGSLYKGEHVGTAGLL
jgi:dTDP-4-amino-4,6-dideoxygalactose transaminase